MSMGIVYRLGKLFVIKIGICAVKAHIKSFAAKINGIGTGSNGGFKNIPGSDRGQLFN
jgi:hypothetical protein